MPGSIGLHFAGVFLRPECRRECLRSKWVVLWPPVHYNGELSPNSKSSEVYYECD